ncbi:MAG: 1,2-phenylacetyl-CoA epoxidase subunit PaaD [Acidimicrobiales bacterium]
MAGRGVAEREATAWEVAASVPDPELPWLTVADLGILRQVRAGGAGVVVTVTPTYSGCPALPEMMRAVRDRLVSAGLGPVELSVALSPPWTTDWITEEGRRKLAAAGVAPPGPAAVARGPGQAVPVTLAAPVSRAVPCPQCGSGDTVELSRFGATACRALYRCRSCLEPFDHVRPL